MSARNTPFAQDEDEDYDAGVEEGKPRAIVPETGMPFIDEDEAEDQVSSGLMKLGALLILPRLICAGIAFGIYSAHKDVYEARLTKAVTGTEGLGWLFLAGVLFCICSDFMNMFPGVYKGAIMGGPTAGNLNSNMQIFKTQMPAGQSLPYAVMEQDGYIGKYNRANRAMYHFVENGKSVLIAFLLGGLVFGEAIFVTMAIYLIARVWYQIAYSKGGYGMGCCQHGVPFMIHTALAAHILEMLVLIAGVRMIQLS